MPLPRYCRQCDKKFQPASRYNYVCNDCYIYARDVMVNRQRAKFEIKRLSDEIERIRFDVRIHPVMRLELKAHNEMLINAITYSITPK